MFISQNVGKETLQSKRVEQTSGDLAHLCDGGVVGGHAAQLLRVGRGRPRQPQHQRKEPLVPAEGLLGQLAAGQRGVQGQVKLREKKKKTLTIHQSG